MNKMMYKKKAVVQVEMIFQHDDEDDQNDDDDEMKYAKMVYELSEHVKYLLNVFEYLPQSNLLVNHLYVFHFDLIQMQDQALDILLIELQLVDNPHNVDDYYFHSCGRFDVQSYMKQLNVDVLHVHLKKMMIQKVNDVDVEMNNDDSDVVLIGMRMR